MIKDRIFCVSQDWGGGKRGVIYFLKCHPVQKGASHTLKLDSKVGGAPEAGSPVLEIHVCSLVSREEEKGVEKVLM